MGAFREPSSVFDDWREFDVENTPEMAVFQGLGDIDDIDEFSKLLSAQILALFYEGSIESTTDYLHHPRSWSSSLGARRPMYAATRLRQGIEQTIGDGITFGESELVCNFIKRPKRDNPYFGRPKEALGNPWVRQLHAVTATQLLDRDTERVRSFAGLSFSLELGRAYRSREVSVRRPFLPGVRLAAKPEELYPHTTTFSSKLVP